VAAVLHAALARTAFGQQCASFWWDAYVPKAVSGSARVSAAQPQWSPSNWADAITRMSGRSPVLRKSLYALSLASAGCQQNDGALIREGQRYYGETLLQLGQLLQHPRFAAEDECLLPTCLQLADYEVSPILASCLRYVDFVGVHLLTSDSVLQRLPII
jgi:hypothetical protein